MVRQASKPSASHRGLAKPAASKATRQAASRASSRRGAANNSFLNSIRRRGILNTVRSSGIVKGVMGPVSGGKKKRAASKGMAGRRTNLRRVHSGALMTVRNRTSLKAAHRGGRQGGGLPWQAQGHQPGRAEEWPGLRFQPQGPEVHRHQVGHQRRPQGLHEGRRPAGGSRGRRRRQERQHRGQEGLRGRVPGVHDSSYPYPTIAVFNCLF